MIMKEYDLRSTGDIKDALKDVLGSILKHCYKVKWILILGMNQMIDHKSKYRTDDIFN